MRTIAALIIAASAAMTAMAEPITLREAMQELRNRGAAQVEGVLLHGVPVIKGTKYAANCWLHQYDYAGPHHAGCTT